jgi:hypothetical protein
VPANNYGTHLELNDELQVEEVHHVWLTKPKNRTMKWQEINPKWLESYTVRHSFLQLK